MALRRQEWASVDRHRAFICARNPDMLSPSLFSSLKCGGRCAAHGIKGMEQIKTDEANFHMQELVKEQRAAAGLTKRKV